jgi:hypothetical protein
VRANSLNDIRATNGPRCVVKQAYNERQVRRTSPLFSLREPFWTLTVAPLAPTMLALADVAGIAVAFVVTAVAMASFNGAPVLPVVACKRSEGTMRYMLLIYQDEELVWKKMTDDERRDLTTDYLMLDDKLSKAGTFVYAEPLAPSETAITVRVRDGRESSTPGPIADTSG